MHHLDIIMWDTLGLIARVHNGKINNKRSQNVVSILSSSPPRVPRMLLHVFAPQPNFGERLFTETALQK